MSVNESDDVVIEFTYREKEYIAAVQAYQRHTLPTAVIIVGGLLIIGAVASLVLYGTDTRVALGATFFLLLLTLPMIQFYIGPRQLFRREPLLQLPYWFRFSKEGVEFQGGEDEATRSPWSLYNGVWDLENYYFLFQSEEDAFTIIPKRAFTNERQEQRFRQMLQKHVAPEYEWGPT